jgi:competence protein ComGC
MRLSRQKDFTFVESLLLVLMIGVMVALWLPAIQTSTNS